MKYAIIIVSFLALATSAFPADEVEYFRARSSGSAVIIEWRLVSESSIDRFEVERAGDDGVFRYVATVDAKGSNHAYEYSDTEAFSKPDGTKVAASYFTYRLRIVHSDKTFTYSASAGVTHSVSSIKRTWGMIKQMFR